MPASLNDLDVDLLLTLDALLEDPNLSRVAVRLGVTQPALSARLARLRGLFDEQLFVPLGSGRGLVATDQAMALKPLVSDVIARMRDLLALSPDFDPSVNGRTFIVAAHENPAAMLAPDLVSRIRESAPNVRVAFVKPDSSDVSTQLAMGRYDVLIGDDKQTDADLKRRTLFDEELLSAQRRGHPRGTGPLDLDSFCALDHLLISAEGGGFEGSVDTALAALGRHRRVSVSIQHYALALLVVAGSDLVCTLPKRFLQRFETTIDMFEPPLTLERSTLSAYWHARHHDDPGHRWFRGQVFDAAAQFGRS